MPATKPRRLTMSEALSMRTIRTAGRSGSTTGEQRRAIDVLGAAGGDEGQHHGQGLDQDAQRRGDAALLDELLLLDAERRVQERALDRDGGPEPKQTRLL